MAAATLTMRIDSDLKRDASAVAEYYGFDLSGVTRAFYKQMVRDHAIPLDLGYSNEVPNEETIAAMKEAEEIIAKGGTGRSFKSAEGMMAFIESEADE
ncbi:type II toxin-antitoxin system RelB/DinJ family antitoxin [Xiamenia xianingshaonis]|uniref:Type II toxin-antitoxin system RelB/DinJ family antitoxin n=1 Tax=Xiamenia xianingshaonis TaxID=2682776 RepID=A0ABX0IFW9_9ACTN|nr:type II toxin-antitoxin system RelB/DinJ family antitoxin [Xiamenia xianingshaonis]NHM13630.1 type II toxin-antitoxin system RelB/DinJ family antitoxin [Xiamenia xianingshaonis]